MAMTAKELYEMAQKLPLRERKRLAKWLLRDVERARGRKGKVGAKRTDPFADDPWFAELRKGMKRAMRKLGLRSEEEVMRWLRERPWRADR
jgi:hypothetical protein